MQRTGRPCLTQKKKNQEKQTLLPNWNYPVFMELLTGAWVQATHITEQQSDPPEPGCAILRQTPWLPLLWVREQCLAITTHGRSARVLLWSGFPPGRQPPWWANSPRATLETVTNGGMASGSHHFLANRWGNNGNSDRLFLGAPKSQQMVTAAMKLKDACSLEEKLWPT